MQMHKEVIFQKKTLSTSVRAIIFKKYSKSTRIKLWDQCTKIAELLYPHFETTFKFHDFSFNSPSKNTFNLNFDT